MTDIRSALLHFVSLSLEPADRTVVLGDLAESHAGLGEALLSILGLAVRRQLALWRDWRPWLALLGIAGLTAFYLSRSVFFLDADLGEQLRTYLHHGVLYEMGVTPAQDLFSLSIQFLAILFWAWTSAFLLASLSGRSAWLTGILFYLVVYTSWYAHHLLFDQIRYARGAHGAGIPLLLFLLLAPVAPVKAGVLLSAVWGGVVALRKRELSVSATTAVVLAAAGFIFLLLWTGNWYEAARPGLSNGAWQPEPWMQRILPLLATSWPVAYLAAASSRARLNRAA